MKLLSFKLFFPNFQTGRIYFFGFFEFLFFFFKWPGLRMVPDILGLADWKAPEEVSEMRGEMPAL